MDRCFCAARATLDTHTHGILVMLFVSNILFTRHSAISLARQTGRAERLLRKYLSRNHPAAKAAASVTKRRMIIEDGSAIACAIANAFNQSGYEVGIAQSGAEAVRRMRNARFDAAILDLELPYCHPAGSPHSRQYRPGIKLKRQAMRTAIRNGQA